MSVRIKANVRATVSVVGYPIKIAKNMLTAIAASCNAIECRSDSAAQDPSMKNPIVRPYPRDDVLLVSFNMEEDTGPAHTRIMYWHSLVLSALQEELSKHTTRSEPGICVATEYYINDKLLIGCTSMNDPVGMVVKKPVPPHKKNEYPFYTQVTYRMLDGMHMTAHADPVVLVAGRPGDAVITISGVPAPDIRIVYRCSECGSHKVEEHLDCEGAVAGVKPLSPWKDELEYGETEALGQVYDIVYKCANCGAVVEGEEGSPVNTTDAYIELLKTKGVPYVYFSGTIQ